MKILLIAPASGKWRSVGKHRLFGGRTFRFSLLSLLSVAAESPEDADVRIVDEQIEDIPWEADVDLVGITCMTAAAPRTYELAAKFRERGIPVVLGGMHPTLCPEEAILHADAIVCGEAEGIWRRVVEEAQRGRMRGIYRNEHPPALDRLRRPPRQLLARGKYAAIGAAQATRGCPHGCDFCAIAAFSKRTQRQRPVEDVAAEIRDHPGRMILFVDDNLTADRDYTRRLCEALRPLGKRWATQSTLAVADDPQFLRMLADSGCIGLFVGLETILDTNLDSVNKTCHRVEQYRESISRLHAHGIAVEAGIVFGFDGDTPDVFGRTLRVLEELQVDLVQVSAFTPLPGTPRAERLSDRIFDRDWSHYDFHHVVFEPAQMTPEQLQDGHDWVTREFYRPWRILRRLATHATRPHGCAALPYLAAVNAAYLGRIRRWGITGRDPAAVAGASRIDRSPVPPPRLPGWEPPRAESGVRVQSRSGSARNPGTGGASPGRKRTAVGSRPESGSSVPVPRGV
jgi:radical SAM superfamily enzyme YgiQ (UPF0313 family)